MFPIKGQICVSSFTRQAFKIKSPQAEGGSMHVYASEHLFSRLARIIEADRSRGRRTCGSFSISGRVIINFSVGEKRDGRKYGK